MLYFNYNGTFSNILRILNKYIFSFLSITSLSLDFFHHNPTHRVPFCLFGCAVVVHTNSNNNKTRVEWRVKGLGWASQKRDQSKITRKCVPRFKSDCETRRRRRVRQVLIVSQFLGAQNFVYRTTECDPPPFRQPRARFFQGGNVHIIGVSHGASVMLIACGKGTGQSQQKAYGMTWSENVFVNSVPTGKSILSVK